jgi:hypothetical protein
MILRNIRDREKEIYAFVVLRLQQSSGFFFSPNLFIGSKIFELITPLRQEIKKQQVLEFHFASDLISKPPLESPESPGRSVFLCSRLN